MTIEEAIAVIEQLLERGRLTKVQEIVFRGAWTGETYADIARASDYDEGHIKDVGAELWRSLSQVLGEKVTKNNLQGAIRRAAKLKPPETLPVADRSQTDWGEAPDVSRFYGRAEELALLSQWILQEGYRLIALLGMGGMGKTALSVKLIEQVQHEFQFVIWRSLRSAPLVDEVLIDLLQVLSNHQIVEIPASVEGKVSQLMTYLQQYRCLLVLDNFEAILGNGTQAGIYRVGYEGYRDLLNQVGTGTHRSQVLLTSREKPKEVATLEGIRSTVRSLALKGLTPIEGQAIFQDKGCTGIDETVGERIVNHYAGNPLALKIAASAVQEVFAGDVAALIPYLEQGRLKFGDISDLLDRQFDRLTLSEQHLFYWLCINREPVPLSELEQDIVLDPVKRQILDILTSLVRRCLVEQSQQGWFLQPVVLEYMTDKLIVQICREIAEQELALFRSHALLKATAKDFVRQAQIRLILSAIVTHLIDQFGNQKSLEFYLTRILTQLQQKPTLQPNYAAGNLLNLLRYLQIDLTAYDFSGLAVRQAYLQDARLPKVNFAGADLSRSVFSKLFSTTIALAFDSSGTLLATGDSRCDIQIWEVASGKHLMTLKGHQSWIWSIVFSPDARFLASGSDDYSVKIWDLKTKECLQTLKGPPNLLNAVKFAEPAANKAGRQSATIVGQDSGVWHPELLEQQVEAHQGHTYLLRSLTYSPDAQTLALSTRTFAIKILNIQTGECLQTLAGHSNFAPSLKFNSDGTKLGSVNSDKGTCGLTPEIKIWDIKTGDCQVTLQGHRHMINDLAFSSNGQWLATASSDQTLKLWNLQTGKCVKSFLSHSSRVLSVTFAPDDRFLVSAGDDRTIKLWDIQTGHCIKTIQGYTNAIYSMSISPDRQVVVTTHEDESIKLWNLATGTVFRTLHGHRNRVWCAAFPPQLNELLASSSADYSVKLWNWQTGHCLRTLQGHTNWVWSVAFSPDGQWLASGSYDRTIKLWNVQTGECVRTLQEEQTSAILPILFSLDGKQLFSGEYSGVIRRWNVQSRRCLQSWDAHDGRIFAIVLHPDQPLLASGGNDQQIRLWDLKTGECLRTLQGHQAAVSVLKFTTDGQLISGSFDQTIRVWNFETGECLQTIQGHQSAISAIIDHTDIITSSLDQTIRFWNRQSGDCLKTWVTPRPYEGMNITGATGLTEAEVLTLEALGAIVK